MSILYGLKVFISTMNQTKSMILSNNAVVLHISLCKNFHITDDNNVMVLVKFRSILLRQLQCFSLC